MWWNIKNINSNLAMSNYNEPNISLQVIWVTLLICSVFHVVMSVMISAKKCCSIRLFLQLLVRGLICGIYVCVHIVVSSTYVFALCFLLCTICCQFLWIVHFFLPLRYCYAGYISICILNRCNHGNDLSEMKITRFFSVRFTPLVNVYVYNWYHRYILIVSLYTKGVMYEAWFTDLLYVSLRVLSIVLCLSLWWTSICDLSFILSFVWYHISPSNWYFNFIH